MNNAKETLEQVLIVMEDRGLALYEVCLNKQEIEFLLDAVSMTEEEPGTFEAYRNAYDNGFQRGYQQAVLDMGKRIKEMKTYGGGYKKIRPDGMPEHNA